jgi:hypothetical protein
LHYQSCGVIIEIEIVKYSCCCSIVYSNGIVEKGAIVYGRNRLIRINSIGVVEKLRIIYR